MIGTTTRASSSRVETALSAESGGTGAWSDLLDTIPRQAPSLQAKDPLIMVNVGTEQEVREIPVSASIDEEAVRKIKAVLELCGDARAQQRSSGTSTADQTRFQTF